MGHTNQTEGVSLSAFLARVKAAVNSAIPDPVWVRAEIRKVQAAKSGHVYLELEERSDKAVTIASTKGAIWKDRFPRLDAKFVAGTGDHLMPDIKVLLLVRAQFHVLHGFDLIIEDIDPSYTLGDLLAKMNRIRVTLKEEGVFGANRALPAPAEFVRVAVISPATSAGQGDFRSEADPIGWGELCHFDYFTAVFQGAEAPASIRNAMRAVFAAHNEHAYDALVIIRGGGSMADLAWLNDLSLARWACRIPIPILTGIGHERDSTILDEIAHRRFDTPSKVVLHIASTIRENAFQAIKNLDAIAHAVRRIVAGREHAVALQRERLAEQADRVLELAGGNARHHAAEIRSGAIHGVREAASAVERESLRVSEGIDRAICNAENAIDRTRVAIEERARARVGLTMAETEKTFQEIALTAAGSISAAGGAVEASRDRIERECRHRLEVAQGDLRGSFDALLSGAGAAHRQARTRLSAVATAKTSSGPREQPRRQRGRRPLSKHERSAWSQAGGSRSLDRGEGHRLKRRTGFRAASSR